ncbi:HopW family type III effector protein [Pseudomonas cannabina]|uniref:HopW family type III effector protein n=2 Tax=Pseudomonas cannabina TaxID=86840 RepID=UPI00217FDB97|nr:HopW family type III effector protein [Pseudomonas cannabina]
MSPAQIIRTPHSFPPSFTGTSSSAENSHAQSPQQVLTRAFVASGELNAAFGRTSTASEQDFTSLLGTLQRELERKTLSFPDIAELANQLAEAAKGDQGGHWLGRDEQQTLKGMIDRCKSQLAHTHTHLMLLMICWLRFVKI